MTPQPRGDECWLLTGSQGLYGPEALAQVEQQSQQLCELLDATARGGDTSLAPEAANLLVQHGGHRIDAGVAAGVVA